MAEHGKVSWPSMHSPPMTTNPLDSSINYYQPNSPNQQQQHYQRPPSSTTFTVNNNNTFGQQSPPMQSPQQLQESVASVGHYFSQNSTNPSKTNYFDNLANANSSIKTTDVNPSTTGDGWGDWDWNENNITDQQQQQPIGPKLNKMEASSNVMLGPPPVQDQQRARHNTQAQVIAESFGNINNNNGNNINDVWSWGSMENQDTTNEQAKVATKHREDNKDNWCWEGTTDNLAGEMANEHPDKLANSNQAPPPAPAEFALENHNYNVMGYREVSANSNSQQQMQQQHYVHRNHQQQQSQQMLLKRNQQQLQQSQQLPAISVSSSIPGNSVFMSQAKPVTMPARQYAAPPPPDSTNATSVAMTTSSDLLAINENNPILPPPGYQNNDEVSINTTTSSATVVGGNNNRVMPPKSAIMIGAPPISTNIANSLGGTGGNPFKRAGTAQHYHANSGLMTTERTEETIQQPQVSTNISLSLQSTIEQEPENHETPQADNLINNNFIQQPLLSKTGGQLTQTIPNPNAMYSTSQQINDERNQYLQTSHLSSEISAREISVQGSMGGSVEYTPQQLAQRNSKVSGEQQSASLTDNDGGLLPPPGLSRLVLGEPELEESSSQRLVTGGTDAPSMVLPPSTLRLDERHADGEDTSSDTNNSVSVIGSGSIGINLGGSGEVNVNPSSLSNIRGDLSNERRAHLYGGNVVGGSDGHRNQQQQRVVTGVENIEQRELNMDGENINDEQQQPQREKHSSNLQQQSHNQQQQLQQQQLKQHITSPQQLPQQTQQQRSVESTQKLSGSSGSAVPPNVGNNPRRADYQYGGSNKQRKDLLQRNLTPNDEDDSDELLMLNASAVATSARSRHKYEAERDMPPNKNRRATSTKHKQHQQLPGHHSMDRYEDSDEDLEYSDEMDISGSEGEQRSVQVHYSERSVRSNDKNAKAEDAEESIMMSRRSKREQYYYRHDRDRELRNNRDRDGNYQHRNEKTENRNNRLNESSRSVYNRNERNSLRQGGGTGSSRHHGRRPTNVYDETEEKIETSRRSQRAPEIDRNVRRSDRSDNGADYDEYHYRMRSLRGSRPTGSGSASMAHSSVTESSARRERRGKSNREGFGGAEAGVGGNAGQMDDYDSTLGRRRRKTSDKPRDGRYRLEDSSHYDAHEYEEEFRKHSSRTGGRDGSDLDLDNTVRPGRHHHDNRHAHLGVMGYGYPGGGYYDPYAAYYYSQMARTNPQAYAEWYKKYYGAAGLMAATGSRNTTADQQSSSSSTAPAALSGNLDRAAAATVGTDGRESVHSGRSSIQKEYKDRYITQAYLAQASNDYQRHYHHHYQLHNQQNRHHQSVVGGSKHQHYDTNSTMLDHGADQAYKNLKYANGSEACSGSGSGIGIGSGTSGSGLPSARSQSNLSQFRNDFYAPLSSSALHSSTFNPEMLRNANLNAAPAQGTSASGFYARSDYAGSRTGGEPLSSSRGDPAEVLSAEVERLTPCKFLNDHTLVHFTSGVLVTLKPKYTTIGGNAAGGGGGGVSVVNVVKLYNIQPKDDTKKLLQSYPGPLVRGLSHKKTIIEFCEEQILLGPIIETTTIYAKQLINHNVDKYCYSYTLLWQLLILLLRQNGMVVGTDIAELLLKNQQEFPYKCDLIQNKLIDTKNSEETQSSEQNLNENGEEIDNVENCVDNEDESEYRRDSRGLVKHNNNDNNKADTSLEHKQKQTNIANEEQRITEKFRNFLLYGNVNEAIDWATENNLWGHALFLASKLDRRTHANVMMRFANKLSLNDPLQTLYQLMSGRVPCSVTCVQDEKWGDWRPHLSMILSNTTQRPELYRKSIASLGDSLFNRGDLYAAHFCYLMAQMNFGRYQDSAVNETTLQQHLPKLVLLGSSHYKHFRDFAHNEAIIMTEIYEYACSLNDEKFSLNEFQSYKFLLATRFLDYGYHLKSLMYLEQIALHITRDPSKYDSSFINKVYELADRLKFYDPVLEKTLDDQPPSSPQHDNGVSDFNIQEQQQQQQLEGQKWLQSLRDLANKQQNDKLPTITSGIAANAGSESNTKVDAQQEQGQQQINQQFAEINRQFNELNLQYQGNQMNARETPQIPMLPVNSSTPNSVDFPNTLQQPQNHQDASLNSIGFLNAMPASSEQYTRPPTSGGATSSTPIMGTEISSTINHLHSEQYFNQQQQQQFYDNTLTGGTNPQIGTYDYWQQSNSIGTEENNTRPTITMPCTRNYDTDEEQKSPRDQHGTTTSGATTNISSEESNLSSRRSDPSNDGLIESDTGRGAGATQHYGTNMKRDKTSQRNHGTSQSSSGWFGGIWNKFSLKPKNQMILPDDKNPTIVWDPDRKQWINTDADENEMGESLKPPPKLNELMQRSHTQQPQFQSDPVAELQPTGMMQTGVYGESQHQPQSQQLQQLHSPSQQQQQQQQQPQYVPPSSASTVSGTSVTAMTTKIPTLQSNMFKMQRNRTLKNSYVDVFNPSGAPINQVAESIMAPAVPPAVMMPQGNLLIPSGGNVNFSQQQQQQQQQSSQMPQFYNPNQFLSNINNDNDIGQNNASDGPAIN